MAIDIADDQKDTIDSVLDYYYEYAAKKLGYRIRFDKPWRDARERMEQDRHFSGIITKESMKKYYQTLL